MMYSCKQATELMSTSLDGELSLSQRFGLRLHLFMCKLCSRCWKQMLLIRDAMHNWSERLEDIDFISEQSLSPEACDRIKNSLRQHKNA